LLELGRTLGTGELTPVESDPS